MASSVMLSNSELVARAGILSNMKCALSGCEAGPRKLPLMCALPCFVLGPLKILSHVFSHGLLMWFQIDLLSSEYVYSMKTGTQVLLMVTRFSHLKPKEGLLFG